LVLLLLLICTAAVCRTVTVQLFVGPVIATDLYCCCVQDCNSTAVCWSCYCYWSNKGSCGQNAQLWI